MTGSADRHKGRYDKCDLIVVSGLPGTGKSTVAAALAAHLEATWLSIDPIEDALLGAGLPPSWETGVAAYAAARVMAEQNLARGRTVVVDAVNDSEAARNTWRSAAATAGAMLQFVLLSLDDEAEHRRRLEGRVRALRHVPEPTWDQVRARAASYEAWRDGACLHVSAAESVDRIVDGMLIKLAQPPGTSSGDLDSQNDRMRPKESRDE